MSKLAFPSQRLNWLYPKRPVSMDNMCPYRLVSTGKQLRKYSLEGYDASYRCKIRAMMLHTGVKTGSYFKEMYLVMPVETGLYRIQVSIETNH